MLKIRHNTFESNSSSMHTLIRVPNQKTLDYLREQNYRDIPDIPADTKLIQYSDDFYYGRNYCMLLESPLDKATYLITYYSYKSGAITVDHIPEARAILEEVQKTHPNFEGWVEAPDDGWYTMGCIDHQSLDILDGLTFEEVLATINDPEVVYIITSDEEDLLYDMRDEGMLTEDDFVAR